MDIARRRAEAEHLDIDIREGDAEDLLYGAGEFDAVLSAIGVMFTADHARAAAELVRVCRPGGTIALASWTPTGFVGQLLRTVSRHVPPAPVAQPPTRWGTEEGVRELLGDAVEQIRFEERAVTQRFFSPGHFADFFLEHYGPTRTAAGQLDGEGRKALRADMVALAESSNTSPGGAFTSDWHYLVVVGTAR